MSNPQQSPTELEATQIIVEWPNQPSGIQKASRGSEAWQKLQHETEVALNRAMGTIQGMAHRLAQTVRAIDETARPDEAEIEFGLNLDTEVGALVAKTSTSAQFTVKFKWAIAEPQRAKVIVSE